MYETDQPKTGRLVMTDPIVTDCTTSLSVIITAHDEGEELRRTIHSVRSNTHQLYEIIVVDDGSTDGSCQGIEADDLRVVRHDERIGVAASRNDGCAVAKGDVFAFLDGHQRVSFGCLDQCGAAARQRQAIVWPDVRGLQDRGWTGHGASLCLCDRCGYFGGTWIRRKPRETLSPISTLIVPGYVMPREVYEQVGWIQALRGWGASEPAITVKAFFLSIPLLHLCGPLARHLFRKNFPYSNSWQMVWRNHALVARICFDDRTWFDYWLPEVFEGHLTDSIRRELESPDVLAEHETFLAAKVRSDQEFFELVGPTPVTKARGGGNTQRAHRTVSKIDDAYIRQQRGRSKPGEYKTIRPRVDAALIWMSEQLPVAALVGKRGLDVGTRDGYAIEAFRRLGISEAGGIELVPETADYAARRGRAVRQADMRQLPDQEGRWDLVTSIHSLEHCPEPERAIAEMVRVLRPGGWLFLVVPREETLGHDPLHLCVFPNAQALRDLVVAEGSLDTSTIREDLGILAKGCRELRLLIQKKSV